MATQPIDDALFREALARFASGVTVVGAHGEAGVVGFTATGFTSVSLSPPLVLVCVGKRASVHDGVVGAESFGVSVLSDRQGELAEQFARSGVDRFRGVSLMPARVPLVEGALVHLECRRYARHDDAGDHTILIGEVIHAAVATGHPLVHFTRRFGVFVGESGPRASNGVVSAWGNESKGGAS
jgi:flavin reductase (DIM6/NTAB) family NADH-FMN oxidoreductase RutF